MFIIGGKGSGEELAVNGEGLVLKKKEIVVQLLSSEPKKTTMKYIKEGPRVFVPYKYEEITIANMKGACKIYFHEQWEYDILASELGPSCTRIDQISNFKIVFIRFIGFKIPINDLKSSSGYQSNHSYQNNDFQKPAKKPKLNQTHSNYFPATSGSFQST